MALVSSDLPPGPPPSFHASALAALLRTSKKLSDFVWTEHERPLVAHDQFETLDDLPVIDLAAIESGSDAERQENLALLVQACRDCGFFQVINHGVPSDVIMGMDSQSRSFFKQSLAQKVRVLRDYTSNNPLGYMYGGVGTHLKSDLPWMEALQMPAVPEAFEAYSRRIWEGGNSQFGEAATEFSRSLKALAFRLLRLLLEQLGLVLKSLPASVEEQSVLRFNCYPPCPQPSLTLGLGAHSDPHLLTILHQDDVGGLQICKGGKWIAVRPRMNSFVVNVGDALQVWSNDIYKSVEHRAVCNSARWRFSMAFFLNPADDFVIAPAPELTDPDHPAKYRSFTWQEYREAMYVHRIRGKSNLLFFKQQHVHDHSDQTAAQSQSSQIISEKLTGNTTH